jgi:hypothetical protein
MLQFQDLRDCAYSAGPDGDQYLHQLSDRQLQEFRNDPKRAYILNEWQGHRLRLYRNAFAPLLDRILRHLIDRGCHTIWTANPSSADTLLLLADINTDNGDADAAAKYLVETYLAGQAFIEPSSGGKGRHVYFKVDVKYCLRQRVWEQFTEYAEIVRSDPYFATVACHFTTVFCGLPTLWQKNEDGHYNLLRRGSPLKLPYVPGGMDDINTINSLRELPISGLEQYLTERRAGAVAAPVAAVNAPAEPINTPIISPIHTCSPSSPSAEDFSV